MASRIQCINRTIHQEGGWVMHDKSTDTGGLTYAGLTKKWTLDRADKPSDAARQLWTVLKNEGPASEAAQTLAKIVYKENYWDPLRCSDLPDYWGVKWSLFDASVLYGPREPSKWLQKAVGARVDGVIGDRTVAAARGAVRGVLEASRVAMLFRDARIDLGNAIVKKKPHQEPNLKGWKNRAHWVCDEAMMRDRGAD